MTEATARSERLRAALAPHVDSGAVPGLVALVANPDGEDVVVLGDRSLGGPPMTRDSLFRIASITKPVTAAVAMVLVERGVIRLDDPVADLLPELAHPRVLRTLTSPVDDTVPAVRPITVRHLLTFTGGHGFPSDFSAPVVALLFSELHQGPPDPKAPPPPDEWMRRLGAIPLLHQPGDGWTYNGGADVLGVLLARACGRPLADVFAETVLDPLGMRDTGFHARPADAERLTTSYRPAPDGGLEVVDGPPSAWLEAPDFPSAGGGLVSTVDDWAAFGRMLLAGGDTPGGRVLSPESVRLMTTPHLDETRRAWGSAFLDGQNWGWGGGVDVVQTHPWNRPGRYGWVGGTGTVAYVVPATGLLTVLLTQVELAGPSASAVLADFLRAAQDDAS